MTDQPNPTTTKPALATTTAEALPATKETEKTPALKAKPEDPYKPVNIKVLKYLKADGSNYKEIKDDTFQGILISFDKPTDSGKSINYDFQHFNKFYFSAKKFKTTKRVEIDGDNSELEKYSIENVDKNQAYYFLEPDDLDITVEVCAKNYLVQARRQKTTDTFSEWGTELHTEFMINGKGKIFGGDVDVTYSTRKQSVGMTEGKSFKIKYANIRKSDMGKSLPARIFDDKPESTLLGISVAVSKLNYNMRNKNFQLAVSLKTNDIDISTDAKENEYCDDVVGKRADYKTVADYDKAKKEAIASAKKLREEGLQLFPGVVIQEINFAVEITDETPTLSIS